MTALTIIFSMLLILPAAVQAQSLDQVQRDSIEMDSLDADSIAAETIEFWGLTAEEWQQQQTYRVRYQGLLAPGITPLEVLGVTADDPAERARYARLYAERQNQVLRRIRRFEEDYLAAMQALSGAGSESNMRLVVAVNCLRGTCAKPLAKALARANQGEQLNIYVVGARTDNEIRRWAAHHAIPIERVQSGQISLNYAPSDMQLGLEH